MDALSDILRAVRLTGGVFLDADFSAPWCVRSRVGPEDCRGFAVSPEHVIATHYVVEGRLSLHVTGEPVLELGAGDLVLLARNDPHLLGSDLGCAPVPAEDLIPATGEGGIHTIRHGGGGERTRVVCGFLASESGDNPILASLPRVLSLRPGQSRAREWIECSFRFAAAELAGGRPGSDIVLAKLSELLFVEAVRACLATLPPERKGLLGAMRDPSVGRALDLLHGSIAYPWTVEDLARQVGVSRSVLGERFATLLGVPPMRYLTRWRMRLAARRLRETSSPVARIAEDFGYESEAAFSRAFRRELGVPPVAWRRMGDASRSAVA